MQTITTKYVSPTATSGAKIRATSTGGDKVTVPYNYNDEKLGHVEAAQKLKDKLGWKGEMVGGNIKDGYVFVFVNDDLRVNPVPPLKSKRRKKSSTGVSLSAALNMLKNKGVITASQKDINEAVKRLSKLPQPTTGYYYADDVDDLAAEMVQELIDNSQLKKNPSSKPPCKTCKKKKTKIKANPRKSSQHHAAFKAKAEVMGLKGQYIVLKSDDGVKYNRIATFVLKANAIDYAKAYANAAPKSYIKVERI